MLSLPTLIGLPLVIISKCVNIFSKPTEPKVSSVTLLEGDFKTSLLFHVGNSLLT